MWPLQPSGGWLSLMNFSRSETEIQLSRKPVTSSRQPTQSLGGCQIQIATGKTPQTADGSLGPRDAGDRIRRQSGRQTPRRQGTDVLGEAAGNGEGGAPQHNGCEAAAVLKLNLLPLRCTGV